jgi:glycosyltransferase involved in cell wall biosynthesis
MMQGGNRTTGKRREHMSGFPVISIVMVTWNAGKHFRQAIESIIIQDYPNMEIIVVDGGSVDNTLDIVSEFESEIDYWISEPDKGIYDAMNKGIGLCTGDWIGFKNADDWYVPGAFSILADRISKNPKVDLWYGNSYSVILEDPLKVAPFFTSHHNLGRNSGVDHRCSFVRAELHKNFLFNLHYRLAADLDVFWRLKKSGALFKHTGEFMAYKRFGGASDGASIYSEAFRINRIHMGLIFAIQALLVGRLRFLVLKTGNSILKFIIGDKAYHRFKSRKIQA